MHRAIVMARTIDAAVPVGEPQPEPTVIQVTPLMPYVDHGCEVLADGRQLWAVSLPGMPGCIAQGSTLSEAVHALANIFPHYLERVMEAAAPRGEEVERVVPACPTCRRPMSLIQHWVCDFMDCGATPKEQADV